MADYSSNVLIDHVNDIEKRRRVVVLKQKELEAKIAFENNEQMKLKEKIKAMEEEEVQLKLSLNTLTEEHSQLQLQLMSATDLQRRCEVEEPLLMQHSLEKLESMQQEIELWKKRMEELRTLEQMWSGDSALQTVRRNVETLTQELLSLQQERKELVRQCGEEQERRNRLAQCHLSGIAPTTVPSDQHSPTTRILEIADAIQKLEFEFTQEKQQGARQIAKLTRELEDLKSREEELDHWRREVKKETELYCSAVENIDKCAALQVCLQCLSLES